MQLGIRPKTHIQKAVFFILLSALFNAFLSALAKFSYSKLTMMQMVFARNFIALLLFSMWLAISKKETSFFSFLRPGLFHMQVVRALAGFTSICLFIYSLKTLDLSDSAVLYNTMPIFLPFVAYLWKGIKIHHKSWWGIIPAFIGILFVVQPGGNFFNQGTLYVLLSGLAGAISTLSLRLSHYTDPSRRTLFYYFLITSACAAVFLLFQHSSMYQVFSKESLLLLTGIGVLGLLFQIFFTLATKYAPARLVSPFYFSTVIFSALLDWLLWNVNLDMYKLIGFVLVFIGVCLVVLLYPKDIASSKPGAQ